MNKNTKLLDKPSKYMSWVLRHGLTEVGLVCDEEGYVKLSDFLNLSDSKKNGLDHQTVLQIINQCAKQRFNIKTVNNELFIRANQGHSKNIGELINSDKLLVKINEPIPGIFHGTYIKHLESIKKTGLNRMSRQHIHFAKNVNSISGKRSDCNLIIYINMKEAMLDGIIFFESANGVILTEGINGIIPVKYLSFS